MTSPPAVQPRIPNPAIAEATGIDFTLLSRLRRQELKSLSMANARAVAAGLAWPVGEQFESWAAGTYGADLEQAAARVGLRHSRGTSPCVCPECLAETAS